MVTRIKNGAVGLEEPEVVPEVAPEVAPEVVIEPVVELISIEDYVLRAQPNMGLVASFKAEPLNSGIKDTLIAKEVWDEHFSVQSQRQYL